MRHVLELVAAFLRAGSPAEVVECDSRIPALGEAKRELLVEAVEAADVGKDHDADARWFIWSRKERREPVPVARFEDEVVV